MKNGLTWRVSGDLGDTLLQACVMASIPGKHIILCVNRNGVTAEFLSRVPLLKSLLESQPYIEKMICSEEEPDIDLVPFRRWHSSTTTLPSANAAEYHSQAAGEFPTGDGTEPWLTAEKDQSTDGRVIIARSPRYQNGYMPWDSIVKFYGKRLMFVGLDVEYADFVAKFGYVEYRPVKDFLELARLIAGSSCFIGNQSSPHAIAMGLGHRIIQETCLEQPDCIFNRANIQYVSDGSCLLPDLGNGTLQLESRILPNTDVSRCQVPPGLWQYPGLPDSSHFTLQQDLVRKLENCTVEEADTKLVLYNISRLPDYFRTNTNDPKKLVAIALEKAKIKPTILK